MSNPTPPGDTIDFGLDISNAAMLPDKHSKFYFSYEEQGLCKTGFWSSEHDVLLTILKQTHL